VNNASNSLHVGFEQMTEAQFDELVNVHFKRLLPDPEIAARDERRRTHREYFIGPDTLLFSGEFCIRSRKRSRRGSDPTRYLAKELGPRAITAKCGRAGRDSN
jgi:hypothetical protein